jgi:NitT/TauT family transport system ATP-binding protein
MKPVMVAYIEAKNVNLVFTPPNRMPVTALKDFNVVVGEGEFVSIVGPSGCGKSTLLRMLAGLDSPTAGALDWPGDRPGGGDTGFVFQEATLLPWATVWDNIYLPLRLAGTSRAAAAEAVDAAVALVGLDGFEQSHPRQLSGGMKMRTSVARALVTRPRMLLMDEPFAALDEITRFRLNDDLLRIFEGQRCTVVFVTHSVFEAVYLSQRVVVMSPRPGRVVADHSIDLPQPRRPAMRTGAEFGAICRAVSDDLERSGS